MSLRISYQLDKNTNIILYLLYTGVGFALPKNSKCNSSVQRRSLSFSCCREVSSFLYKFTVNPPKNGLATDNITQQYLFIKDRENEIKKNTKHLVMENCGLTL